MNRMQVTMMLIFALLLSTLGVSVGWSQQTQPLGRQQGQQQDKQDKGNKGQQDINDVQHDDGRNTGSPLNADATDDTKQAVLKLIQNGFGEVKNVKFTSSTYEGRQYASVWAMERGISLIPGTGIYGVEFDSKEGTHLQCTYVEPMNQKRVILRHCVIELNMEQTY